MVPAVAALTKIGAVRRLAGRAWKPTALAMLVVVGVFASAVFVLVGGGVVGGGTSAAAFDDDPCEVPGSDEPTSLPTVPGGGQVSTVAADADPADLSFELPQPDMDDRKDSIKTKPLPIPENIKKLYVASGKRYGIPWALLAGIGMEETKHGRDNNESGAGALGLMQFMPATFASVGVDGDGDGKKDILNDADSAFSAGNYLVKSGVKRGPKGVKQALFAYNRASWYVNDVLYFAHKYGGGEIGTTSTPNCTEKKTPTTPIGDPTAACDGKKGQLVGLNKGRPWLSSTLIALGKQLQGMGLRVGEHPDFGGVHPVHGPKSLHYYGIAIDVNGGETDGRFDKLARKLWAQGFGVQWKAFNHRDHMHVDVGLIGRMFVSDSSPFVRNPNAAKLKCEPSDKKKTAYEKAA